MILNGSRVNSAGRGDERRLDEDLSLIDGTRQIAKFESILREGNVWEGQSALAALQRWENDERLTWETRQRARRLVRVLGDGRWRMYRFGGISLEMPCAGDLGEAS